MDRQFYLIVAVFAVVMRSGTAIKCYNCASKTDSRCADPFNTSDNQLEPQECTPDILNKATKELGKTLESFGSMLGIDVFKGASSHKPPFVCQKLDTEVEGEVITVRSCQIHDSNIDICEKIKSKMQSSSTNVQHCSMCDTEGCNGAPAGIQSASLMGYLALTCVVSALWARMVQA